MAGDRLGYFPRTTRLGDEERDERGVGFAGDWVEACCNSRSMRAISAAIRVRRVRVILPILPLLSGCRSVGMLVSRFSAARETVLK